MVLVKIGDNLINPDNILWINMTENHALIEFVGDDSIRVSKSQENAEPWDELTMFISKARIEVKK